MISYYFRTIKDSELKEIGGERNGVWVHVESPSGSEISDLLQKFHLDEGLLEDAQDFFEVPRLERSEGVTYFFTRYPYDDPTEDVDTAPLLIIMGESFVVTVAPRPVPQFEPIINGNINLYTTQKTKLFIQIMEVITQSFERQLIGLRRAMHRDRAELRRFGSREIERFVNYEHRLNDMVAALVPTNVALKQVMNGHYFATYDDDLELMEDLRVDNVQAVDSAQILLKTIQNVRSASEAILTNNLNNRIKTLTVLTILLTVPTVISSLFGMNVPLPLAEAPHAFALVVILVIALMSLGVWYFKKHEWF